MIVTAVYVAIALMFAATIWIGSAIHVIQWRTDAARGQAARAAVLGAAFGAFWPGAVALMILLVFIHRVPPLRQFVLKEKA